MNDRNPAPNDRNASPAVALRPLARADFPLLHRWLTTPHVLAWWPSKDLTLAAVERKYGPRVDDPAATTHCSVIEADGVPVGMIQSYRHADHPEWDRAVGIPGAAGIDYLIGEPDRTGRGIGPAAIAACAAEVFARFPEAASVVAAPQRDNRASCRALEKAGFTLAYRQRLESDSPSDAGVSAVYTLPRPGAAPADVPPPRADVAVRPLARADFPVLFRWLTAPHVQEWWPEEGLTPESVAGEYGPHVDGTSTTRCSVIEAGGEPVGLIQCYRHADDPDWDRAVGVPDAAGIDYLIGEPDRIGRGIGSAAIAAYAPEVFTRYPEAAVVVAAPQRDNRASCRALEKAGFSLVYAHKLDSDDPSDAGVSAVYALRRPRA